MNTRDWGLGTHCKLMIHSVLAISLSRFRQDFHHRFLKGKTLINVIRRIVCNRYFLFQAALIPCICLRNEPLAPQAPDWRSQIVTTLETIAALAPVNLSANRSHQIISELCGRYLEPGTAILALGSQPDTIDSRGSNTQATGNGHLDEVAGDRNHASTVLETETERYEPSSMDFETLGPIDESPQTQINSVFSMIWPNVAPLEAADLVMGDDSWMEFLGADGGDDGASGSEWFGV
jgi:transcriptional regulatory protein GAL4